MAFKIIFPGWKLCRLHDLPVEALTLLQLLLRDFHFIDIGIREISDFDFFGKTYNNPPYPDPDKISVLGPETVLTRHQIFRASQFVIITVKTFPVLRMHGIQNHFQIRHAILINRDLNPLRKIPVQLHLQLSLAVCNAQRADAWRHTVNHAAHLSQLGFKNGGLLDFNLRLFDFPLRFHDVGDVAVDRVDSLRTVSNRIGIRKGNTASDPDRTARSRHVKIQGEFVFPRSQIFFDQSFQSIQLASVFTGKECLHAAAVSVFVFIPCAADHPAHGIVVFCYREAF